MVDKRAKIYLSLFINQEKRNYNTTQRAIDTQLRVPQGAWLVAPKMRQSPIAIMTMNPTYELHNKPLIIEYPTTIENFRLNNTGFSWEVKIPYQISMATLVYGAHLHTNSRYRLDQFHCHWGSNDDRGSEHTVDNKCYSAEIHFVHYNMEKYHSMSRAARHPDGLVVLSVFLEAQDGHRNHLELEKIVNHLKLVNSKGDHTIVNRSIKIENLLPPNRSYWSYQGSLTTPPYLESVTWFILKHPIKCSKSQIQKFRTIKSSRAEPEMHELAEEENIIRSNHREVQPLNGRTIVNYNDPFFLHH